MRVLGATGPESILPLEAKSFTIQGGATRGGLVPEFSDGACRAPSEQHLPKEERKHGKKDLHR